MKFLTIKRRILLTFIFLSSLSIYYFYDWVQDSSRRHYLEAAEEVLVDQLIFLKSVVEKNTGPNAQEPDFQALKIYWESISEKYPEAKIYQITKKSSDQYIYVTDLAGKVIYHSQNDEFTGHDFSAWRNVKLAMKGNYGARSTREKEEDPTTSVMHVSYPVQTGEKIIGTVTLVKPVKRLSQYLDLSRKEVLKIAVITLILFLLSGFLLVRRIVRPIEELTDYTEKVGSGEKPSLPKLPEGELNMLGKTIDEMRRNLDGKSYIESYIQSLTHELKSPIAAIKGASELIEADAISDEDKKLLRNINRESERMSEMVQNLLLLSRLENFDFSSFKENLDLSEIAEEIVDEMKERYTNREFQLKTSGKPQLSGDRFLVKTALNNVISNAVDFSEGAIQIEVDDNASVTVVDSGTGIPDYALKKVKEKFFSLPRPGSGAKSSGLGLSIVQEIMEIHGGDFAIENRPAKNSGVSVTLNFPHK